MEKISKIIMSMFTIAFAIVLTSCTQTDGDTLFTDKLVSVSMIGYNDTYGRLNVKANTITVGDLGRDRFSESFGLDLTNVKRDSIVISVTDTIAKQTIVKKAFPVSQTEISLRFAYIGGKVIELPKSVPAPNPNTSKFGMYIVYEDNDLADLRLEDLDYNVLTYVARKIKPNKWEYIDIDFITKATSVYPTFYKAGTTTGYFYNDVNISYVDGNPFFPTDGTKSPEVKNFVVYNNRRKTYVIEL